MDGVQRRVVVEVARSIGSGSGALTVSLVPGAMPPASAAAQISVSALRCRHPRLSKFPVDFSMFLARPDGGPVLAPSTARRTTPQASRFARDHRLVG